MWVDVKKNSIASQPNAIMPDSFSDSFRDFMKSKGVIVDTVPSAFRCDNIDYDFVTFRGGLSIEQLQSFADEWNQLQRAAKPKSL